MFNSIEFKNPTNLIYLIIPIACVVCVILGYRKKEKIIRLLKLDTEKRYKYTRFIALALGLCLVALSLLGPQTMEGFTEVNKKGLDIYVLIDTSNSMLVEDIQPNRMSRAKRIVEDLLNHLDGDRVGFIPFSSSAYIQMPLTDDYQLARMFLEVIDTDMIGGGGTDIGTAISLAADSFKRTASSDKVMIVLSDGEEHDSNSTAVLKEIQNQQIKIYTVGIGTQKGGLVPVYDASGKQIVEYKKDRTGQFVTSKLNAGTMKQLADNGGLYVESTVTGNEIESLMGKISLLKRDTLKTDKIKQYKQLYQYFLGAGMILLLLAFMLPERRTGE